MYDYIIVTHLPAFYKVNLYNEIAKKLKIFVIFISKGTTEKRANDFTTISDINFDYKILNECSFQYRNIFITSCKLLFLLNRKKYRKVLLSGWDLPEFWIVNLFSPTQKNCLALESTIIESRIDGFRGMIKRTFLLMTSQVYASGDLHVELLKSLHYKKNIVITRGVGIINKPSFKKKTTHYGKNFIYVGRLVKVKNLEPLINIFNKLPDYNLTIAGDGIEKLTLMSIANDNVNFVEPINNSALKYEFGKNDFFILPSISETWGLVVEEALYFGLPVIVTKNCGASELILDGFNGYVVDPSLSQLEGLIKSIDTDKVADIKRNLTKVFIDEKDALQVSAYGINIDR